ncbi:MAG TPA: formate/nitrite transporter family protein [Solirubrobacteraceae bacterium]|jgi:formate/nitrite transporter FocA (FNT family)|nr:formate/nitrite transporter family protein [Solirubrobacteraceae bacterium]
MADDPARDEPGASGDQPEAAPEPHEMFARTREEGERRLRRSPLELAATSLVAGFDIVFGVVGLTAATAAMTPHFGREAAHLVGSLVFGIAFVFIVVGRSELFTENFLVPITAMRRGRLAKLKLAQLWSLSPVMNIVGGTLLILVVSSKGVLPQGAAPAAVDLADKLHRLSHWSAFLSAVTGGALITVMTWMVEGVGTVGGRIVVAWTAGMLLALAGLDHVIVATLELILGMRFGADVGLGDLGLNFVIAAAGNMLGGLLFVTLTRTSQAIGAGETNSPAR